MLVMALPRRLGRGAMSMLSHAGDGTAEATWPWRDVDIESYWRRRCRVMLARVQPRRHGHGAMSMSSHAGDGVAEATWSWCDVDAESYW
jgi:hypothetical protein